MIQNVYFTPSQSLPLGQPVNNASDLIEAVSTALKLPPSDFYLTQNGKLIRDSTISKVGNVWVHLRLLGGKGGFGSMLRAIGAQIEKTTNREACRDLSGRRLRDINEEKRLKTWLEKQSERDEEAATKRAKKIEKLRAKPKHEFQDDEYFNARSSLVEDVSDALEEGLKNAITSAASTSTGVSSTCTDSKSNDDAEVGENESGNGSGSGSGTGSGTKRKVIPAKAKKPKKKLKGAQWLDEGLSSGDSSDSDSNDSSHSASSSKKQIK